jgi:hypothetical protein
LHLDPTPLQTGFHSVLSVYPFSKFGVNSYKIEKFLNKIEDSPPEVLIMLGPFLPADHELV